MIHVFYKNRNTIGQFMVALMFLGTFGFLFTYDGFAAKSEAKNCCGGGEPAVTSFAADSSGDFGSAILMDAEATDGCCGGTNNGLNSSSESSGSGGCNCLTSEYEGDYTCSDTVCSSDNACGQNTVSSCNTDEGGVCEDKISGDDCGCNAVCKLDGNHSTTCDAKGCQGP